MVRNLQIELALKPIKLRYQIFEELIKMRVVSEKAVIAMKRTKMMSVTSV